MKKLKFMKHFFLLTVFFIGFQSRGYDSDKVIETNIRTCGIVNSEYNLMGGELSDYWAQELIGSDLLREELREISAPSQPNFISVFDGNIEGHHPHNVRYLISGRGVYAVLPELGDKISVFETTLYGKVSTKKLLLAVSQLKEDGAIPSFINHSMSWSIKGEMIYKIFKSLSPYSLVVTSSGNHFHYDLDLWMNQASLDFNVIIVGSFSPLGFVSHFSKEGEEVLILAPSDDYITSASSAGEYSQFGGTSGAAPLVTGALAGFEWVSDYHPTGEEAKILLSKTAIPTIHLHEQPQLNGIGLLNAYKLGRVAKRLKDKCQTDEDCFQQEIRNEENYLFPYSSLKNDEGLGLTLSQVFPSCSFLEETPTVESYYPSCDEKAEAFKKLKHQVLLSPERKNLWESLSCIYKEAGFLSNALMLDRIALALPLTNSLGNEFLNQVWPLFKESNEKYLRLSRLIGQALLDEGRQQELLALSQSANEDIRLSLASMAAFLREEVAFSLLNQLAEDPSYRVIKAVAYSAGKIGGEQGEYLLKQLIQDTDYAVRNAVVNAAGKIGGELGLSLLKQLVQDTDNGVKSSVASSAGMIGGDLAFSLLNQLIQDTDYLVREAVTWAARDIGGELGFRLLNQLIQNRNSRIREMVALSAGDIGGELGFRLLNQLIQDTDPNVRWKVAQEAGDIDGQLSFKLLNQLTEDPDSRVRETVASSAGMISGELAFSLLNQLARDPDPYVRMAVATAAGNIGGEEISSLLNQLAEDPDPHVRGTVATVEKKLAKTNRVLRLKQVERF